MFKNKNNHQKFLVCYVILSQGLLFTIYVKEQFSITKTNGKYDSAYPNLVKPQEELDILGIFTSAIYPELKLQAIYKTASGEEQIIGPAIDY